VTGSDLELGTEGNSWLGIDRADASHEHLEHDLFQVLGALGEVPEIRYVGTRMVRGDEPHWAASIELVAADPAAAGVLAGRLATALDQLDCAGDHLAVFSDPHQPKHQIGEAGRTAVAALATAGQPAALVGAERGRLSAYAAAAGLRDRLDTRVVRFPGQLDLPTELTRAELLGGTPIADLIGTGSIVSDDAVLRTYGHVRPSFIAGELVLVVMPDADDGATVRPFELPVPRQCCETPEQFDARWRSYLETSAAAELI
jgi:hypothetical protein